MRLQYIHIDRQSNKCYITTREKDGTQKKFIDKSFYPSYYIKCDEDEAEKLSYFGAPVKQVFVKNYWDMAKVSKKNTFEKDLEPEYQYILDKVPQIEKSKTRWVMFDIENLVRNEYNEVPNKETAHIDMVSAITVYDNYTDEVKNIFMGDILGYYGDVSKVREEELIQAEKKILNFFIKYIKEVNPDVILAWNIDYDMSFLYHRCLIAYGKEIMKFISPFEKVAWGRDWKKPMGINCVDYMELYKKYTMNKHQSYSLSNTLDFERGFGKKHEKVDFRTLDKEVNLRNIDDVKDMVEYIEKKKNLIEFYDNMRIKAKMMWEDLPSCTINFEWFSRNSKLINNMLLIEGRKQGIVLPNKGKSTGVTNEDIRKELELIPRENMEERRKLLKQMKYGAYRECFKTGRFQNVKKVDLGSAYPRMIVDANLSPANLLKKPEANCLAIPVYSRDEDGNDEFVETYYYKQNENDIVVSMVRDSLTEKDELKEFMFGLDPNTKEAKDTKGLYDLIKSIVNSQYGVLATSSCRLLDIRITNTITFLVRNLFAYCLKMCKEENLNATVLDLMNIIGEFFFDPVFCDTDSFAVMSNIEDIEEFLNRGIIKWSKETYGKEFKVRFELEGSYVYILNLAKCRYRGLIKNKKGEVSYEDKGLQTKRSDSSQFQQSYMDRLLNYILIGVDKTKKEIENEILKLGLLDENIKEKTREEVEEWIENEKVKYLSLPIIEIAKPKKIKKPIEEYKTAQIQHRALKYTNEFVSFAPEYNDLFYIIYVKPFGREIDIVEDYYYKKGHELVETKTLKSGKKVEKKYDKLTLKALEIETQNLKLDQGPLSKSAFLGLAYEELLKNGRIEKRTREVPGKFKNVVAFNEDNMNEVLKHFEVDYDVMLFKNLNRINSSIFGALKWIDAEIDEEIFENEEINEE